MELNESSGDTGDAVADELEQLYELLYLLPVGVVAFDGDGVIARATPLSVQLLNPFVKPVDIGNAFTMLAPLVSDLAATIASHEGGTVVLANHRATLEARGSVITVELSVHRPRPGYYVAVIADVTELVRREHELRRERDRVRLIVEMVREYAIYTTDRTGLIDSWNASGERLFGLLSPQAIGRPLDELISVERLADVLDAAIFAGWCRTEGWALSPRADAFYTDTMVSTLVAETGEPEGFIIVTRDATEMQRREEDLRREADTDPLTQLANRRGFESRADRLLTACAVNDVPAAVLMVDIDHFKAVNDTYGHDGGDRVLCAVGAALASHLRAMDLLGRLGGEEFAVLMPGADLAAGSARAEALRLAIAALVVDVSPGVVANVTVSLGAASYSGTLHESLQRADAALYLAKSGGRNRVVVAGS